MLSASLCRVVCGVVWPMVCAFFLRAGELFRMPLQLFPRGGDRRDTASRWPGGAAVALRLVGSDSPANLLSCSANFPKEAPQHQLLVAARDGPGAAANPGGFECVSAAV